MSNPTSNQDIAKRLTALANLYEREGIAPGVIDLAREAATALQGETPREPEGGGHGELCAFCGESCDIFAGDPGRWPLAFGRPDGTGEIRYHHSDCVTARLFTQSPPKTSCKPLASTDGGASPSRPSPSSVECPKCRTQLAFEGDVCGLCE